MKFLSRNKLLALVVAYLTIVLVAIPITLVTLRKPQETRTNAVTAATLSFSPTNLQKNTGDVVPLDIMVDPGTHSISFITLDITYDPTLVSVDQASGFQINTTAFPTVLEGPVYEPGRIRAQLSIGSDPTKAITASAKVATVTFTAVGPTNGEVAVASFGESSNLLSVGSADSATNNVLGTVQPELMTITGSPTAGVGNPVAPVPTFVAPLETPALTSTQPTNAIVPTDAVIPTDAIVPNCTPLPAECQADDTLPICSQVPAGGYCPDVPLPTAAPNGQPTQAPVACGKTKPADIMLVLDTSGSMKGAKIGNAKTSADSFIDLLKSDATNRFGVVSFSKDAKLLSGLTQDDKSVKNAVNNLQLGGSTCVKCGLAAAGQELSTSGRPEAKKIMILLTDGKANAGGVSGGKDAAEKAAVDVTTSSATQGLTLYTIGVGNDVNPGFLQQLASETQGTYYFAANSVRIDEQFKLVYKTISDEICQITNNPGGQVAPTIPVPSDLGRIDPVTIIMVILLFLPLLLLIGHLLV
jgi:uncharacterized protein YegL